MRCSFVVGAMAVLLLSVSLGCQKSSSTSSGGGNSDSRPTVAYVTNGIASFWVVAEKGVEAAAKKFDANALVRMPPKGPGSQKRMVQELLTLGVDGIAISPISSDNQADLLREISERTKLITHDADAPKSDRICYVGMDNYVAGRACGRLVKEALPEGGTIMIFVGRLEQANAKLRRQGLIDELLDRSDDSSRYDPPNATLKGEKYTILDTRTDGFDNSKAKANAQDAIVKYPDLSCMVGLFAYNPPFCLDAVREAGKIGQIKIVAFDEDFGTLQGIEDGEIAGTVVQNPYRYGYESVRILAGLARGDESVLPEGGFLEIPHRIIKKDNLQEFWTELKHLLGEPDSE